MQADLQDQLVSFQDLSHRLDVKHETLNQSFCEQANELKVYQDELREAKARIDEQSRQRSADAQTMSRLRSDLFHANEKLKENSYHTPQNSRPNSGGNASARAPPNSAPPAYGGGVFR